MSCQYSRSNRLTPMSIFAVLPFFASQVWAAPLSNFVKRSSGMSGGSKIMAPVVVAVVFLFAFPILFYRKVVLSRLRRTLGPRRATTAVRDLTAEEIAGTAAVNQAQGTTASRTDRRARRNRRTPSQISTRSLPAYMKEPGEHELVIIQGSQDMEDAPLTTQVVMPSLREDEDESMHSHSRDMSHSSSFVILNDDSLVQTPLLVPDESNETTYERNDPNDSDPVPTVDISEVRPNEPPSPLRQLPDPRGEAPPYFEVVGNLAETGATSGLARVETTDTLPTAPDSPSISDVESATAPVTRRRSVLRGLIDAASRALSQPHATPPPPRTFRPSMDVASSPSPRPSNLSTRPARARSPPAGHRTTASGSGSVFSIASSAFGRAVSRTGTRSISNLPADFTSPSTLSITSISAPLTHTAVRTDFVYPRSGPTPEQLKLISSVESVSKFGVPYGAAAVAYASASLVNVHGPPPGFEETSSLDGVPGTSDSAARARSRSTPSRMSQNGNTPESQPPLSPTSSSFHPDNLLDPWHPDLLNRSTQDLHRHSPKQAPKQKIRPTYPSFLISLMDSGMGAAGPVESAPPRAPSPSPRWNYLYPASDLDSVTESPDDIATSTSNHKTRRRTAPTSTMPTMMTMRKPVAPTSFRAPSAAPPRGLHPGSRSSSIETFRTALSSGHGQPRRSFEHGMSDTDLETDAFTDAESGGETETET
ncbi:hypothetical protein BGW80DRAFT_1377373 [Lactifluus volemus]|nr:hypothetical protein BGW80DRAFT_1377373 [Lactifluus volemus]